MNGFLIFLFLCLPPPAVRGLLRMGGVSVRRVEAGGREGRGVERVQEIEKCQDARWNVVIR